MRTSLLIVCGLVLGITLSGCSNTQSAYYGECMPITVTASNDTSVDNDMRGRSEINYVDEIVAKQINPSYAGY